LRGYLARELSLDRLKALAADGTGVSERHWRDLAEMGVTGLLVPAEHGGAGLGVLDAAVAAEALGYAAAPVAFAGPAVMAPLAVTSMASASQQAEWLPKIASGRMRIAVAFVGGSGQTGRATARLAGDTLDGRIDGVIDAAGATHVLTIMPDGKAALVSVGDGGVTVAMRPTLDRTRPIADVTFSGARAQILDTSNDAMAAARRVRDAGRVMLAADTLGSAQAMLDKAVAYAGERVQFGRVIASFQAIKHMCADMMLKAEASRSAAYYAACVADEALRGGPLGAELSQAASLAKASCSETAFFNAGSAIQMYGGVGFTWEYDVHLYFKRARASEAFLGAPSWHRERIAQELGL